MHLRRRELLLLALIRGCSDAYGTDQPAPKNVDGGPSASSEAGAGDGASPPPLADGATGLDGDIVVKPGCSAFSDTFLQVSPDWISRRQGDAEIRVEEDVLVATSLPNPNASTAMFTLERSQRIGKVLLSYDLGFSSEPSVSAEVGCNITLVGQQRVRIALHQKNASLLLIVSVNEQDVSSRVLGELPTDLSQSVKLSVTPSELIFELGPATYTTALGPNDSNSILLDCGIRNAVAALAGPLKKIETRIDNVALELCP